MSTFSWSYTPTTNVSASIAADSNAVVVSESPVPDWTFRLTYAFLSTTLETLRKIVMANCSTSVSVVDQAMAVAYFGCASEVGSVFDDLIDRSTVEKSGYSKSSLALDGAIKPYAFLYPQALNELASLGVPGAYRDIFNAYLTCPSYRHRVSAVCAVLVLAAILLQEKGL